MVASSPEKFANPMPILRKKSSEKKKLQFEFQKLLKKLEIKSAAPLLPVFQDHESSSG